MVDHTIGGFKHSKTSDYTTSSDGRVDIDINNDDDELEIEETIRPIGRDKAKKKAYSLILPDHKFDLQKILSRSIFLLPTLKCIWNSKKEKLRL